MTNDNYSIHLDSYDEPKALAQLLKAADEAMADLSRRQDNGDYTFEEFTIIVNGVQTAFYLGGPQYEALIAFIQHIAAENFYHVDLDNSTVDG